VRRRTGGVRGRSWLLHWHAVAFSCAVQLSSVHFSDCVIFVTQITAKSYDAGTEQLRRHSSVISWLMNCSIVSDVDQLLLASATDVSTQNYGASRIVPCYLPPDAGERASL